MTARMSSRDISLVDVLSPLACEKGHLHLQGGIQDFCTLVKIFVAIQRGGITYFFRGEVGVICV